MTHSPRQSVTLYRAHGIAHDELDRLRLWESFENPERWEQTMRRAYEDAKSDAELAGVLVSAWLQEDREEAFASFMASRIPGAIERLMARFMLNHDFAGRRSWLRGGHLAYALSKRGFKHVSAMDPNSEWNTGTGYLKAKDPTISVINELDEWRRISAKFHAVVTFGTIHHWQHIPLVALDARRVLKPGDFWFALSEYVANTPREFAAMMHNHPTASRYKSYEWAYPASAYVDLVQTVGFNLVAVIPHFYHRNEFVGWMREPPNGFDIEALTRRVDEGFVKPNGTVDMFWDEVDAFRRGMGKIRLFTDPQAFIFQRVAPW